MRTRPTRLMADPHDDIANTEDFFEMSLDNLCVAGLDGYFKRVNPSWTRTLGWSAAELLSRPSIEFVHPEDREQTLGGRETLKQGSAMGPLVNRYLCKDGAFRWFEWRSIAHLDRGLVYAAARDVTEQKLKDERLAHAEARENELRRQLAFSERMASIGTLARGVAHEINNPLACVTANVAMMIEALDGDQRRQPKLLEMADEVQRAAERIRKIVGGLRTFSRADEERRAAIDLRPLLELAIDLTLNHIRARARLVTDFGETPWVDADEARLGQVFNSLLMNASEALPEKSRDVNEIRVVTTTDAQGRAVVEVRDTGAGIDDSVMPRIFDPFFTTKPIGGGAGLGLSICHTIVTGMGGEITVMSKPGHGTTFRVMLPGVSPRRSETAAPVHSPRAASGATVLVVDDEPAVGTMLGRVLGHYDVTVVVAAKTALELLEAGKRFDVIFSDLMMPEMSGMEFYDQLEQRFPDAARRVIFVSGGAFTPRAHAFLDRVHNPRIDKPFDVPAVRSLVDRHIAAAREA